MYKIYNSRQNYYFMHGIFYTRNKGKEREYPTYIKDVYGRFHPLMSATDNSVVWTGTFGKMKTMSQVRNIKQKKKQTKD